MGRIRRLTPLMAAMLMAAVLLALMAALPSASAMADYEEEIVELDTSRDIVIWVTWDVQQPQIVFIAPGGSEYDPYVDMEGTSTVISENSLFYFIENAQSGVWRARYDEGTNETVEITVHNYYEGFSIESFTRGEPEGSTMQVSFLVQGAENGWYSYKVSAVTEYNGVEKELAEGTANFGSEVQRNVNLSVLSTYDGYFLKLTVWQTVDGADMMDFAFTEPFAYENIDADSRAGDFYLTVYPEESLLEAAWQSTGWRFEGVTVALFEDGEDEPTYFDTYETSAAGSAGMSYDPSVSELSVEVAMKINGVTSSPVARTVRLDDYRVDLPEDTAINTVEYTFAYRDYSNQAASVTINGETGSITLDGTGTIAATLEDGWNDFTLLYEDPDGVTWRVDREIFVDRTPPRLTMSQSYDGMTVDRAELVLSGRALDCENVTVNGKRTEQDSNGIFTETLKLDEGANVITVVAADALGNESLYTATVYRGGSAADLFDGSADAEDSRTTAEKLVSADKPWIMIGVAVVGLLVIGYALIFWRKGEKK